MVIKLTHFVIFFSIIMFAGSGLALGACIGGKAVWGTGDDRVSCAKKQLLKKKRRDLEIERAEKELEDERQRINNSGTGSGTGNTNVILGGLQDMLKPDKDSPDSPEIKDIPFSQHQLRVEWMPYVIPGAYHFDEPGMPGNILTLGVAWEYFLNKNLGVGFLIQQWEKTGARNFDPVMTRQRDGSGDTAVFFPGAVDRMKWTSYTVYATINAPLADNWMTILRLGFGRTQVDIEYSGVNPSDHPYAIQPKDATYTDDASLMGGLAIEKWTQGGTRIGAELRYHNARHNTSDYTEYVNMGSAQVIFYVQFMLKPLGLL